MPCSCRVEWETYPQADVWGPILWRILHATAERTGRAVFPLYQPDERRYWASVLKSIGKMIPCPVCKEHYLAYWKENDPEPSLKSVPYGDLREFVRRWIWDLHNWVNESHQKPQFPFDELMPTYSGVNVRAELKLFRAPLELAIKLSGTQILGYQEFTKHMNMLLSVYGV